MNQTANLISLIIATRKRVSSLSRLFDSIEATSEHPECIEVLLAVDDDDIDTINFVAKSKIERNFRIKSLVEKRGKGYVELHERINNISWFAGGKFLFLLPDDVRFMTNGWDKKVLFTYNNAYKDNIFWIRTAHNEVYNPWASCFGRLLSGRH
jgi:glycosyltransferase involved in cell wall biosynthesis